MHSYSDFLRKLLEKRGIVDFEQAEIFLNPDYKRDMNDPFTMHDMHKACDRLASAINNNEKIIIYADYDCDGIPGAVILNDFFTEINYKNYEVYIPERNSEGYGLNKEAVASFAQVDVKLLITIDLGITAIEEVDMANKHGIDVIVTDHHLPKEVLPKAYAILNPKVDNSENKDSSYPDTMLCGAGVMFKFVQAMVFKYGKHFNLKDGVEKWMLDMAGLATLSDMVPLVRENRAIAYFGMKVLKKSPRPGLQKLLAHIKVEQRHINEDDVGFMLTPRLNAASRMGSPIHAFELLATNDETRAGVLAMHLSKINDERKNIVKNIMRELNKKFENINSVEMSNVIVVGNPLWRVGILGLVAGKLCDQYKRPVFVWGKDENDCIKGSCRSDGSVSVVELMRETSSHFVDFGGHELAGGFTIHADRVHFLEEALSLNFSKVKRDTGAVGMNEKKYDLSISLEDVNKKNWQEIEKMAPFGLGNEKPTFLFEGVKIEKIKKFGKNGSGEHLEIIFSDSGPKKVKAVSFFSDADSFDAPIKEGGAVNLLATFDLSRFGGREELRLRVEDIF